MKRNISLILALLLVLPLSLAVLTACNEKQVPVYRGMEWGTGSGNTVSANYSNCVKVLSVNTDGARYGTYTGDYAGKDRTFDEENPYAEEVAGTRLRTALENRIRGGFGGILNGSTPGYVAPGNEPNVEDYFQVNYSFLNILIDNPDGYEIVSFSLNDEEYAGDAYEAGTSMERLIVKPKVIHTASGAVMLGISFKISNIKYRDGDELKDVIMGGNDTIGVSTEKLVATVTNMSLAGGTLSFDVNLSKPSGIKIVKGEMLAVLFDGERLVKTQEVYHGDTSVSFEDIRPNTLYQCAVGGYTYNSVGEAELQMLYTYAFYTDPVVLFDHVTVSENEISFDYLWSEGCEGEITLLEFYVDGEREYIYNGDTTTVDNLRAGTSYKLVAEYRIGDKAESESITLEFTTLAEEVLENLSL